MNSNKTVFRKGAALAFVVVIFVVVTFIIGIIYAYFRTNLKMAVHQEKNIQAYYCTVAGIEMATGALLMPIEIPKAGVPGGMEKITLLDQFIANPTKSPLTQTIPLPNGRVSVTVKSQKKPGSPQQWISIEAEGIYKDAEGKEYTNKGSVWFHADNPAVSEQNLGF